MANRGRKKQHLWDFGTFAVGTGLAVTASDTWAPLYWPGVAASTLGALMIAMHFWNDDEILRRVPSARKGIAIMLCIGWFYLWFAKIVFVTAPLQESIYASLGDYPPGTTVAGIQWDSHRYMDLRINITNPSDYSYKDLDLELDVDGVTVLSVGKLAGLPDVKAQMDEPANGVWLLLTDGTALPVPHILNESRPTGARITCDNIVKHSSVNLAVTVTKLNYNPGPKEDLFAAKELPRSLHLEGAYSVLGRRRGVDVSIQILQPGG